jgi:AcrR family transcriptional regulator
VAVATRKRGARVSPRRRSADERRDLVVEAARLEFAALGLGGTTGEALSYRAGISHPYLLRLFGSKRELFLEVVHRLFDELLGATRTARPPEAGEPGFDALLDALKDALGKEGPSLLFQTFAACGEDEVRLTVQRRLGELYESLERVASAVDVEAEALLSQLLLIGALDAVRLRELAGREPWARRLLAGSGGP